MKTAKEIEEKMNQLTEGFIYYIPHTDGGTIKRNEELNKVIIEKVKLLRWVLGDKEVRREKRVI